MHFIFFSFPSTTKKIFYLLSFEGKLFDKEYDGFSSMVDMK